MDNMDNEEIVIKGFTFFRSYYESLSDLDPESRLRLYDAIFAYAFAGKEPELSGLEAVVFKLIRPTLDTSIRKYVNSVRNGQKGGRCGKDDPDDPDRTQTEPRQNPDRTQIEPR